MNPWPEKRNGKKTGKWLLKFRDPNGRPRLWKRESKKEAEAALRAVLTDIDRGVWTDPRTKKSKVATLKGDVKTWGDIIEKFKTYYSDRAPTSQLSLTFSLKHINSVIPENTPVSEITPSKVQEVRDFLHSSNLSLGSKKGVLTFLKHICKWSAKHPGIPLDENPAAELEHFRAQGTRGKGLKQKAIGKEDVITAEEAKKMLVYAHKHKPPVMAYLLETALFTGMRKGELCGLLWCYVDFDARTIRVCRNYDRKGTKSGEERTIPMTPELVSSLREWKAKSPHSRDDDPVFPGSRMKVRTVGFPWSRFVKSVARGAGVKKKVIGHDTRSFYATQWLLKGGSDALLARILGHRDTSLIHRVYSHFTTDDLVSALDGLDFTLNTKAADVLPLRKAQS